MTRDVKVGHIRGLDGLRGLAALAVFGVHLDQVVDVHGRLGPLELDRLLRNGNHGVALFFVLSGFLLSMPFWEAVRAGTARPSLRVYAVRRGLRILPAYYVCLTALLLLEGWWRVPGAGFNIGVHYAFVFNLTEFTIFSINAPFWTLAVEMQFYALLPLLLLLVARRSCRASLARVAAVGVGAWGLHFLIVSSVQRIVPWPPDPVLTWIRPGGAVLTHSVLAHLPHFLLGVGAARLFLEGRAAGTFDRRGVRTACEVAFWLSLALVVLLLGTELGDRIQLRHGRFGLPVVPVLLTVVVFTAPATRVAARWLDGVPLRPLGAISYGLYIYHVPCLRWIDRLLAEHGYDAAEHGVPYAAAGLLAAVLVATVSYVLIERPALRRARRWRPAP